MDIKPRFKLNTDIGEHPITKCRTKKIRTHNKELKYPKTYIITKNEQWLINLFNDTQHSFRCEFLKQKGDFTPLFINEQLMYAIDISIDYKTNKNKKLYFNKKGYILYLIQPFNTPRYNHMLASIDKLVSKYSA